MRKTGFLLLGIFLVTVGKLSAVPDPRDSVIIESKVVVPGAHSGSATDTAAYVYIKVSITNKDSLSNLSLPYEERSLSNGAYLIAGRPRNFNGHVNRLTTTLPSSLVAIFSRYSSTPPDSVTLSAFFDATDIDNTAEPPNASRKPFWELKFDSAIVNPGSFGFVEIDSIKILSVFIQFVDIRGLSVNVNFQKSVVQVGVPFQLQLVSPTEGQVVTTRRPTFVWETLKDTATVPASYTVFVADNPGFAPADTSPPLADTMWQIPTDLLVQTTYYWKVRAISTSNDTVFSPEVRSFRVDAAPLPPVDISPPSGSDLSMFDYLVWLESSDPDPADQITYHLQIDDNADFSSPEVDQAGIDENGLSSPESTAALSSQANAVAVQLARLDQQDNLKDDSLYFWRVRAVDNHGLGSAYTSGTRRFYLNLANSSPLAVPGGFIPSGGIFLNNHRPNFSWFQSSDPDPEDPPSSLRYNLRLDTDGEITGFQFAYTTPPGETTQVALDSLAENGHWFWAVRAIDSKGARSPFSALQDFYIDAVSEPPAAFSLLSPGDDNFIVTKTPTLDWEDAAEPDPLDSAAYAIFIDEDSSFGSAYTAGPIFASSYTVPSGVLNRGIKYFWKVQASDGDGFNVFSDEVFRFQILQRGDLNKDGLLTSADIVLLLTYVFTGEPPVDPPELADLNCDGFPTPVDIVLLLNITFQGHPPPCDP